MKRRRITVYSDDDWDIYRYKSGYMIGKNGMLIEDVVFLTYGEAIDMLYNHYIEWEDESIRKDEG